MVLGPKGPGRVGRRQANSYLQVVCFDPLHALHTYYTDIPDSSVGRALDC